MADPKWITDPDHGDGYKIERMFIGLMTLEIVQCEGESSEIHVVDGHGDVLAEQKCDAAAPIDRLRSRALWMAFGVLNEQLKLVAAGLKDND